MFFKTSPIFESSNDINISPDREKLLKIAESLHGNAYDSSNVKGFDCSGFVSYCYKQIGYKIPRSSRAQYKTGKKRKRNEVLPGDIVVFTGKDKFSDNPGHVGIVHHFDNENIWFIHSASSIGVSYSSLKESYYNQRLLGFISIIEE